MPSPSKKLMSFKGPVLQPGSFSSPRRPAATVPQIRDVLHHTWSGPWLRAEIRSSRRENHLPCVMLWGRNGKPSRHCGKSKDKPLTREAGWQGTVSCSDSQERPFICHLSLISLDYSYSSPSHLLYFPLSCWKLQAFWPQLTPEWDWKSQVMNCGSWYKSCPKCRVFNTKTPKSVQTQILPNAAGSNTQPCQISCCMISDRKVLSAHLQVAALLWHAEWSRGFFHSCVKDEHRERHFFSPLGPCLYLYYQGHQPRAVTCALPKNI